MSIKLNDIYSKVKSPAGIATFIYFIVTLIIFYPFILHPSTLSAGTGGDAYQNLWDFWHIGYSIANLKSIYYTKMLFYPIGSDLITQTMSPFMGLITLPFQAFGLIFSYTSGLIIGFTFTGLAMFLLADYLVKNKYAAFFAGLVYAFSAFHFAQGLMHIDYVNLGFIPLTLYFLFRLMDKPSYKEGIYLSIAFALLLFTEFIEQVIMVVLAALIILIWYGISKSKRKIIVNKRFFYSIILAVVIFLLITSFFIVPMVQFLTSKSGASTYSLDNIPHNVIWSDNILEFFVPSYYNGLFNRSGSFYSALYYFDPSEHTAYIGYTVIILSLFAIYKYRKNMGLWILIAFLFGWLALGPYIQIGTAVTSSSFPVPGLTTVPGLFLIYHQIPLLKVIREPDRFFAIFSVAIAIMAAFGIKAMSETKFFEGKNSKIVAIAIISILFLIGSVGLPITSNYINVISTHVSPNKFYRSLSNSTKNFSILILPALSNSYSASPAEYPGLATYQSALADKPLIGGYVTRSNTSENETLEVIPLISEAQTLEENGTFDYQSPIVENYTNQTLLTLYNYQTAIVTVNKGAYNLSTLGYLEDYLYKTFGSKSIVYNSNSTIAFYTLPALYQSVYRSYVSYPISKYWEGESIKVDNQTKQVWIPLSKGELVVYAPYINITTVNGSIYGHNTNINSTVSINAESLVNSTVPLQISIEGGNGDVIYKGSLNITAGLNTYNITVPLVSGPYGNYFEITEYGDNGKPTIGISGISIKHG
ncbi:PMT family glycosyltransferase [Candidatus Mancarchaeum acidiphilum]|uniref:PMT family glycosyltransferase n=1 Tax=Candidatus Mancarchaeum acidiphilum TaxID=1920749 RepID=A0A218NLK4_9ARCH|nr:glycosyltransferase family 39 protein [Candidatus Mancarchaeum acidiphilum]ASI13355.1 PMT family glycosyltransferase [Candidatus Mancarchaeum acidiphilum]